MHWPQCQSPALYAGSDTGWPEPAAVQADVVAACALSPSLAPASSRPLSSLRVVRCRVKDDGAVCVERDGHAMSARSWCSVWWPEAESTPGSHQRLLGRNVGAQPPGITMSGPVRVSSFWARVK